MSARGWQPAAKDLVASLECVKRQGGVLVAENQQLQKRLADSEHEDPTGRAIRDATRLEEARQSQQAAMRQIEQENLELADQLVIEERQNSQLVNLYVAGSQLHSSLELSETLSNIVEIIINLIGADRFVTL